MRGLFILLCVLSVSLAWRTSYKRAAPICNKDKPLSTKCSDSCEEIYYCMKQPDGNYEWILFEECEAGLVCKEDGGKTCVNPGESICKPFIPILCNETGRYPHPSDCAKHIFCNAANNENTIVDCEEGTYFSACTSKCDWKGNAEDCEKSEGITCDSSTWGRTGPVYTNKRLYFKCERENGVYFIRYLKCPTGQIYKDDTGKCEDHPGPGCGIL